MTLESEGTDALDVAVAGADFSGLAAPGRCGWRRLERRYTAERRARYRADPELWVDLVEQAAVEDVTLIGEAPATTTLRDARPRSWRRDAGTAP